MLYYDKTEINKGIDLAKSNNNKECMICHYWFFNHGFQFQDITIITVETVDYCCTIHNISKSEANLN